MNDIRRRIDSGNIVQIINVFFFCLYFKNDDFEKKEEDYLVQLGDLGYRVV